jgi:hypothetical protein
VEIDNLTFAELKLIAGMFSVCEKKPDQGAWEIGKNYLIRTVTMVDTGRLVAVGEHELVLEDAAWIADTGRFSQAVAKAEFGEVEPFPSGRVIIGRGSIVDAVQIEKIPRSQK